MTVSLKFSEKKYCLRILHPSTTANHCVSPHLTNIVKNYPVIITYDELRSISSYFQSLLTPYDVLIALCFLKHSSFVLLVYKSAHTHTHTHISSAAHGTTPCVIRGQYIALQAGHLVVRRVRMYRRGSCSTGFHEIWYSGLCDNL